MLSSRALLPTACVAAMAASARGQHASAWSELSVPAGVSATSVKGQGKLVTYDAGAELHVFSSVTRTWRSYPKSAGASLTLFNDVALLREQGAVGGEHQHAALLPGVALDLALTEPGAQRTQPVGHRAQRQHRSDSSAHLGRAERLTRSVAEHRRGQAVLLAEDHSRRRLHGAHVDQLGAALDQLLLGAAQLRDALLGEQSAEVAQEDDHQGPPEQLRAKRRGRAALVEQRRVEDGVRAHWKRSGPKTVSELLPP